MSDDLTQVHAVLLVPEEGDPHRLLAEGPCGARPPMAFASSVTNRWYSSEDLGPGRAAMRRPGRRYALVLAWGGGVVPEGVHRVDDVLGMPGTWPLGPATAKMSIVRAYDGLGLGIIVMLDAEGKEVTP